ncbi:MAG TPA: hypothetical protein VJH03_11395 [Blastocatellia bacterium]|nr:hypothetical protein [Blastocatellia bacterium]
MAEMDKFERKLAKPWRRLYRIAAGNTGFPDRTMVQETCKAFKTDVDEHLPCYAIKDIRDALQDCLTGQPRLHFDSGEEASPDSRQGLARRLDGIQQSSGDSKIALLAVRVAMAVYDEAAPAGEQQAPEQLDELYAEELALRVLQERFIAQARDGVMATAGRTRADQDEWEKTLWEEIRPHAMNLLMPLLREPGRKAARLPRLAPSAQKPAAEWLNTPLRVLER